MNEFERDRQIDPNQLDVEVVRQADLFYKWAERAVEARSNADHTKLLLDITEARLQARARRDPDEFGLEKVTETAIKAAVLAHDEYISAHSCYLAAREEMGMLDAAVRTMEMKKRMLESLITLHGQQYFAGPGVPRDLVGEWNQHQKRNKAAVENKQKNKARKRSK